MNRDELRQQTEERLRRNGVVCGSHQHHRPDIYAAGLVVLDQMDLRGREFMQARQVVIEVARSKR